MKKLILFILFFLVNSCYALEKIKAEGVARARIIAPEIYELPVENNNMKDNFVIVYTEKGATSQIVF